MADEDIDHLVASHNEMSTSFDRTLPRGPSAEEVAKAVVREQERHRARRLAYDVTVAVIGLAAVALLTQGLAASRVGALGVLALLLIFRPRGDAAARRERRIERTADQLTEEFTEALDILGRFSEKMRGQPPPDIMLTADARAAVTSAEDRQE